MSSPESLFPLTSEINFVGSSGSDTKEIILFLSFNLKIKDVVELISSCETFIPSILDTTPNGKVVLSLC